VTPGYFCIGVGGGAGGYIQVMPLWAMYIKSTL
jgi:hypothetical protein